MSLHAAESDKYLVGLSPGSNKEQVPLLARTVGKEGKFKVTPVKIAVTILCIVSVVITTVLLLVFLVHKNNLDCPVPIIDSAAPSVTCLSDGETTFQFTGSNFLRNSDSETPGTTLADPAEVTFLFSDEKLKADGPAVLEGDCLQIEISHTSLEQCGGFSITYPPYQYENPGLGIFTINNPKPCASQPVTYNVTIVPRVKINTFGMPLCIASAGELVSVELQGDFYQIYGQDPIVTVEFDTTTHTTLSSLDTANPVFSDCNYRLPSVQLCRFLTLNFTLPGLPQTGGNLIVNISSLSKPPCGALGHVIPVLPLAAISSVWPSIVCSAGSMLEVAGQGFSTYSQAVLTQNNSEHIYVISTSPPGHSQLPGLHPSQRHIPQFHCTGHLRFVPPEPRQLPHSQLHSYHCPPARCPSCRFCLSSSGTRSSLMPRLALSLA